MIKCFLSTFLTLTLALLSRTDSVQAQFIRDTLSTGFGGDIKGDGNIFEITAKNEIVMIERFDIHMENGTEEFKVFYRPGPADYTYDESYQEIFSGNITGNGRTVPTPLPAFSSPVQILPDSPVTFYITVANPSGANVWYKKGSGTGTVYASDNYLNITEGYAIGYPWTNSYALDRQWNGNIQYSLASTLSPTGMPSTPPTNLPTHSPTAQPTPGMNSWLLRFESFIANFNSTSNDEIIALYTIGKGRTHDITLLQKGCEIELTADDGIEVVRTETINIDSDPLNELLYLGLNVERNSTVLNNVYKAKEEGADKTLDLCLKLELLSDSDGSPVKEDKQEISVTFDFENSFTVTPGQDLTRVYVGSENVTTQVLGYIEACTCDVTANKNNFTCNTDVISNKGNSKMNVCIWSSSADKMEIDYLDRVMMNGNGQEMAIVENGSPVDPNIHSYSEAPSWNGIYVESIVPSGFFSYEEDTTATVTGVVFLKLPERRGRRVAIALTGHDDFESSHAISVAYKRDPLEQKSAFVVNVALQKTSSSLELELGNANAAVGTLISRFIVPAVFSAAAAVMIMW